MKHEEIVIIGGGASGIGAAIRLRQAGLTDFVLLEKRETLGGTWRDNTYPGCVCDVPSALYSYSFAPNPDWTRLFAGQREIRAYLDDVAARHSVLPHVRFGVEVTRARFRPDAARWEIETSGGESLTARVLLAAAGPWHEANVPDIPGLSTFDGPAFHSSRWDHGVDLAGKRVAIVGTGASAVQIVPAIQPEVRALHIFQRTAQWVLPKPDHYVPRAERWVMRTFPAAQRALRKAEYAAMETLGIGFRHPWILRQVQGIGLLHLRRAVKDPELRARLSPDYTLGCKRLLMSNTYYPALTRSNVTVHATAVREVRGRTLVGADGTTADADVLVLATGFHLMKMPIAERVLDGAGRSLADRWRGSPRAYLGTAVSGYPNLFIILGPNLGTGHSSAFSILEAQLKHVVGAVQEMRRSRAATIDVRPEVAAAYNAEIDAALPGTVYNSGCSSYYLDENGRNGYAWPWSTTALRNRVGRFDRDAYTMTRASPVDERPARAEEVAT
jgi:cation diffusion facilitator CzcD-associated flavoprotein CzcO